MQRSFQLFQQKQCLLLPLALIGLLFLGGCQQKQKVKAPVIAGNSNGDSQTDSESTQLADPTEDPDQPEAVEEPAENWVSLFDGETLDGWEGIEFGGEGDFDVVDGMLSIGVGDPLTGFSSTREDLPKTNYEVSLSVRKQEGIDFFCGLTFPVAESHCTFIVGGWAGATVGLSCIDEKDASSNETTKIWPVKFNVGQWYKIKVRVEPDKIMAWIDDEVVADVVTTGKTISLRGDTTLCRPLGVCNFMTHSEIKDFKFRNIEPAIEAEK